MIWCAIWWAVVLLMRLFWPHKPPRRCIDPNASCPVCGHRQGQIVFERKTINEAYVKHICHVCQFAWYEPTLTIPERPVN